MPRNRLNTGNRASSSAHTQVSLREHTGYLGEQRPHTTESNKQDREPITPNSPIRQHLPLLPTMIPFLVIIPTFSLWPEFARHLPPPNRTSFDMCQLMMLWRIPDRALNRPPNHFQTDHPLAPRTRRSPLPLSLDLVPPHVTSRRP